MGLLDLKKPRREKWEVMKQEKQGEVMMSLAGGAVQRGTGGSHVAMSNGALESEFRTWREVRI